MDALQLIGNCIFFVIGAIVGSAIMYVGPIILEAIDEHRKMRKEDT